jgi:hypothetical protein
VWIQIRLTTLHELTIPARTNPQIILSFKKHKLSIGEERTLNPVMRNGLLHRQERDFAALWVTDILRSWYPSLFGNVLSKSSDSNHGTSDPNSSFRHYENFHRTVVLVALLFILVFIQFS